MNRDNVTRLLTYLEQLKADGEEDKWNMSQYLTDREKHEPLFPHEVTNWHCGTAGCLAGSWAILKVKDGGRPPGEVASIIHDFMSDFELRHHEGDNVVYGAWSDNGIYATLNEAIAYLRLCLARDTMDVRLG